MLLSMATPQVLVSLFQNLIFFFFVPMFLPSLFSQVTPTVLTDADRAIIKSMEWKIKTCTCVYDPKKGYGVVPFMASMFQHMVPLFVTLRDRVGNRFDVEIKVHDGDLHLLKGWTTLGSVYNLDEYGGWIQLTLVDDFNFFMNVCNRLYEDVHMPEPASYFPIASSIAQVVVPSAIYVPTEKCVPHPRTCFWFSYCKFLTADDLTKLCISNTFCSYALPQSLNSVTIVDEWKHSWLCSVEWNHYPTLESQLAQTSMECYLGGGWVDFCKLRNLEEGQEIRIGVAKNSCNVLYLSLTWFPIKD